MLSDADGNAGLVAYETTMLIKRVRRALSASPRAEDASLQPGASG